MDAIRRSAASCQFGHGGLPDLGPIDDLEPPVPMLHQRGATLYPVTVVAVLHAVVGAVGQPILEVAVRGGAVRLFHVQGCLHQRVRVAAAAIDREKPATVTAERKRTLRTETCCARAAGWERTGGGQTAIAIAITANIFLLSMDRPALSSSTPPAAHREGLRDLTF